MTTLPNMGLVLPVEGGSSGVWDTILDTLLAQIDAHNHTPGQGVAIPSSGLNINADVPWLSHAATGLLGLQFTEQAAGSVVAYSDLLFVSSADHNLYFRNSIGTNVQITAGNILNVSIVGGIGGDYSSVGALLSYDDATRRYLLQQEGAPRPWAGLATGDIDLYQKAALIVNKVTLKSPNALAASYSIVWPTALPGTTLPLQMTNAGQLTTSLTFTGAIVAPDFKVNAAKTVIIPAATAQSGVNTAHFGAQGVKAITLTTGQAVTFPAPLSLNDQITGYSVDLVKTTSAATTVHSQLFTVDGLGNETAQGVGASNAANAPGAILMGEPVLTVPVTGGAYVAVWATGGGATDDVFFVSMSYTRP